MFLYLFSFIIFLCVLHLILNYNAKARMIKKIPGPKIDFIFGNGLTIIRSAGKKTSGADGESCDLSLFCDEYCPVHQKVRKVLGTAPKLSQLPSYYTRTTRGEGTKSAPVYALILVHCNISCAPGRCSLRLTDVTEYRSEDIMTMGRQFAKIWDGLYSLWIFPYSGVVVYNPEDVEVVISSIKHSDKSIIYTFLKCWLGDGLLLSKGTKWQERRKILTPAFHFNILKQFCDIINENCNHFVDSLNNMAGKPIDVLPVLSEFTLNSICETAMGTKLSEDNTVAAKSYKDALYRIAYIFCNRFVRVYLYPDCIFNLTPWGVQLRKYLKTIHSFTQSIIEQRKQYVEEKDIHFNDAIDDDDTYVFKKKKKVAMLDLLISAEKEGLIDKSGIQEEVDTFMFEGHDTTASGLTFCLMLIANHREAQDKIREEVVEIFGDSKRPMKIEDLNKMKYLDRVIKESLRMYPPVHFISRNLNESVVLSNYQIPAGTLCHIPILDLHYRENVYKNPKKFDPDRFLPENSIGRHLYAYIPFSAGPRNCIGQKFAVMEMKIAVAKVLQEFHLLPVTRPEDICFTADLVLRHNGPVLVNFIKRQH